MIENLGVKCTNCKKVHWIYTKNSETEKCCGINLVESGEIYGFRFLIDINKLQTSPEKQIDLTVGEELMKFEKELSVKSLSQSAYIISGNRGVGKTTYINYLENKLSFKGVTGSADISQFSKFITSLKRQVFYYGLTPLRVWKNIINFFRKPSSYMENNILFVTCNFVKSDTKQNIIRKLIRSLIITLNKNEAIRNKVNTWNNRKIRITLNELFKRTFHDITKTETNSSTRILNSLLELSWIPALIVAIYYFLPENNKQVLQEFVKSAKKGLEAELTFDSIWKVFLFILVAFIISKLTFTLEKKTI
ncbi:P-loop NTPase fold protein [Peribacillus frigoritolerans]|uniref:P-loop NTPase fold protein n=1 Tax=Peribacillus frigoritolerans TaxID=450367 RepID=UPI003D2AEE9C